MNILQKLFGKKHTTGSKPEPKPTNNERTARKEEHTIPNNIHLPPLERFNTDSPLVVLDFQIDPTKLVKGKLNNTQLPRSTREVTVLQPLGQTPMSNVLLEILSLLNIADESKARATQADISKRNLARHLNMEGNSKCILEALLECIYSDSENPIEYLTIQRNSWNGINISVHFQESNLVPSHSVIRVGEDNFVYFSHRPLGEAKIKQALKEYWLYKAQEWWQQGRYSGICDRCNRDIDSESVTYLWGTTMLCERCGNRFFTETWPGASKMGQNDVMEALRFFDQQHS